MSPALLLLTKILQNCAFVSYASTFLHLQPYLTQFFAFFLQTRRLSRMSFSLQHFLSRRLENWKRNYCRFLWERILEKMEKEQGSLIDSIKKINIKDVLY
jgi:hypothetical protein